MNSKKQQSKLPTLRADIIFELSWEVCNKVGGIYTVITSKAEAAVSCYQDYYLIGPYFPENVNGEFKQEKPPKKIQEIFSEMKSQGVDCYFGKWLVRGEPKVILIDFQNWWNKLDEIKKEFWESFKLNSIKSSHDYDEPLVWSYISGIFLEKASYKFKRKKIIAHFHEWLCGGGLLYLKQNQINLNNVFTTHATVLGRSMATAGINFYNSIDEINVSDKAKQLKIVSKNQLEKLMAQNCDVLTTVSSITGIEVQHFLKREPDQLLLNGINSKEYFSFDEITKQKKLKRQYLREFLMYYFSPYYYIDPNKTLFYFIAGRYESRVKGIDLTIEALSKLNKKLITNNSKKNIIVFFFVPADACAIKPEIWENKEYFEDIKDALSESFGDVKRELLESLIKGKNVSREALYGKNFLLEMEKKILRLKRKGNPSLVTHNLNNPENDEILKSFKENGLENKEKDKVKVVFYPVYLNGYDGLLNLDYQEVLQACDLGVFPSFYEPWGYTPVETAASGTPAITSNLAGFGKFCKKQYGGKEGVFVVDRYNKNEKESVEELNRILDYFLYLNSRNRAKNSIKAKEIAEATDWQNLISRYILAYNQSLKISD